MEDGPVEGEAAPDRVSVKKPYRTPTVVTWGTLREVTQAIGNHGSKDGGRPPRMRTRD